MRVPLIGFDYRLVVLSSFIVIIATYATLAVVERMKFAQGVGWFAWLGGGASGIGTGIWSMHYLGLQTLSLPVPTLDCSSVVYSILATIFASGLTLLVIGGKSDSGRGVKEENQRPMRLEIFTREGTRMAHKLRYIAITLTLLIALSFTFERQAHAYVDPGSGLLIFQGICAAFSGALFYFRRRLKNLFVKTSKGIPQSSRPS